MIYVCTGLRSLCEKEKKALLSLLQDEEKNRILNRKNGICESLVAYALLLYKSTGKTIARDSFGKPYFADMKNEYFSISHTDSAVAVALSNSPIGIDIEKSNRALSEAVLKRICSSEEFLIYKEKSSQEKITLWTLKEAYGKYKGKGVSLPLSSVSFPSLSPLICSDKSIHAQFIHKDGVIVSCTGSSKEEFSCFSLDEFLSLLTS